MNPSDDRKDPDTAWLDAQLGPTADHQDPLVRRTLSRTLEAGIHRHRTARWWFTPALAAVCAGTLMVMVGGDRLPRTSTQGLSPSTPGVVATDEGVEAAWEEEALESPELLDAALDLEDLSDEELQEMSRSLMDLWENEP